jgi:hypothetical protein
MTTVEELAERLACLSRLQRHRLAERWRLQEANQGFNAWKSWREAWQELGSAGTAGFWEAEALVWSVTGPSLWGPPRPEGRWGWPDSYVPVARALLALVAGNRISGDSHRHLIHDLASEIPEVEDAGWPNGLTLSAKPNAAMLMQRVQAAHFMNIP